MNIKKEIETLFNLNSTLYERVEHLEDEELAQLNEDIYYTIHDLVGAIKAADNPKINYPLTVEEALDTLLDMVYYAGDKIDYLDDEELSTLIGDEFYSTVMKIRKHFEENDGEKESA